MSTVTAQPPPSVGVESKLKTTNWGQTFPVSIQTREASLKLVKKLLAVGVSTVLYLRSNIPEGAFNNCDVDGLNVRILNAASDSRPAKKITTWVRSAVEAIEKGYLSRLTLGMYKESQRPEDAEETYNFEFEYVGSDQKTPRMAFGSKAELLEEENAIFSDTRRMLRRIILLTQDLPPLPLGMYLTIVLTYNDVAPVDYNPPGYKTDNLNFKVEEEAQPSILGTVTSRFHKLKTVVHSRGWVEGELQSSSQKSVGVSQKQPLDTPKSSQESVPHTPTSQVDTQCETRLTSSGSDPGTKSIISNTQPSQDLRHHVQANGDQEVVTGQSPWEPELMGSDEPQTPVRPSKRPRLARFVTSEVKDELPQDM